MRSVRLAGVAREAVLAHAAAAYPLEACGLLIGREGPDAPRITRALPCPNVAEAAERTRRFAIDPRAVINVRRSLRGTAERILGFYHSHPDAPAAPSRTDLEHIRWWPETVWLIVPVARGDPGEARAWWLDDAATPGPRELALRVAHPPRVGAGARSSADATDHV